MNDSIPPVFRSALVEPVPPSPVDAEPHRDDDDDGPCGCVSAPLIVWGHGGVSTTGGGGTLLVGWFFVASALALWAFASALASALLVAVVAIAAILLLGEAAVWLWGWLHK